MEPDRVACKVSVARESRPGRAPREIWVAPERTTEHGARGLSQLAAAFPLGATGFDRAG
jgi:hypothetical protein